MIRLQATEAWVWSQRTNGVFGTTNREHQCTQSTTSSESKNSTILIDEAGELTPPRNDEKSYNEAIELTTPRNDEKSDNEAIELTTPRNDEKSENEAIKLAPLSCDEKSEISSLIRSSSCGSLIDSPEPEPLDFERNHDNELESNDSIEVQIININPAPQNEDIQAIYHEIILHDSDTEEISESNTEEKENLSVLSFQSVLSF